MAVTETLVYPFDPTGTLASNKIVDEQQILTPINYRDYHYAVPRWAPYFVDSLQIKYKPIDGAIRDLLMGQDWLPTHEFIAASRACASPIAGSISFLNLMLAGQIWITYQTLGGIWTIDTNKISEILADRLHNPRITAWDVTVDMPVTFPVIDHPWDLVDMVGMSEVVASLNAIEDQLRQQGQAGLAAHLADTNNPHQVTKAQVGLSDVPNYGVATVEEAQIGAATNKLITPFLLKQALQGGVGGDLGAHISNTNNPHQTTASQVGAYSKAENDALLLTKLSTTGVAYDSDRFDGMTAAEFTAQVLTGTAANAVKAYGLTQAQLLTAFQSSGTVYDAARFGGQTPIEYMAAVLAGQAADAAKVYGKDQAQLASDILAGTAANAVKFNNLTGAEWDTRILSFITTASGAQQTVLPGTRSEGAGFRWVELAQVELPAGGEIPMDNPDTQFLVAGGDSGGETNSGLYKIRLSIRGTSPNEVTLDVLSMGAPTGASFGYAKVDIPQAGGGTVPGAAVYIKVSENRGPLTLTQLSQGGGTLSGASPDVVTVEPTGYVTATIQSYALASDVEAALASLTSAIQAVADAMA